jgi:hypothetical protein
MTVELRRFAIPITIRQLAVVLTDSNSIETESLGIPVDFDEVKTVFENFRDANPNAPLIVRAKLDRELAVPLHKALTHLTRRNATDMHMWHWLCTCELKDIVWYRWYGRIPTDPGEIISPSLAERFLGTPSLRGISHNALGRLWWCVETLYNESDEYDLVDVALSSQDFFTQMFDRKFSLYIPAGKAYIRTLRNASEDERRKAARELNHYFTTIAAEALSEEDITQKLLGEYIK